MTDIMLKGNLLNIVENDFEQISEIAEIKQHITIAINTFLGDWILNSQRGIDYVFGLRHSEFLENDIKKQILSVDNVKLINRFSMNMDKSDFTISVFTEVLTEFGNIEVNVNLKNTENGGNVL